MKLLLDSQVLLWSIYSPEHLTPRARALVEDPAANLIASHASLWELFAKIGRGRLLLAGTSVQATQQRVIDFGVTLLPIELDDIVQAAQLPPHHFDPFDRVILAQAILRKLPIVSSDSVFSLYDVENIWT